MHPVNLTVMKNIPTELFRLTAHEGDVRRGDLLVAEPFLSESYFNRAVIALIDYDKDEGATGVVLNNCTPYTLSDVLDGVAAAADVPVYCGGPLGQDRLFFVHTLGPAVIEGAREFAPGIYVGGDFDAIVDYVNSGYATEGTVRFFIGYSSWVKGQLEEEMAGSVWAVARMPFDAREVLSGTGASFWHSTVRALGEAYRPWRLVPKDIHAN